MAKPIQTNAPVGTTEAKKEYNRLFIGKAWNNTGKKDPNVHYTNIVFDRGIEVIVRDTKTGLQYSLSGKEGMYAYPNKKRDGKQDPDLRLSISTE